MGRGRGRGEEAVCSGKWERQYQARSFAGETEEEGLVW